MSDPICNERGVPQSECPPFCPHDFGKADSTKHRAEEAEYHVEQLRDARDRAERRIEQVEALADEWAEEGQSLIRNAYSGGDVHEGQTLERCARQLLGVVRADNKGDRAHVLAERLADDAALVRLAEAEALRTAARRFVDDMAGAWGGDSQWLTTGTRVAEVVACVLREMATDIETESANECHHGEPESRCASCAACAACDGSCGTCPYHSAVAPECDHEWLDRPESDTRECLICGTEVFG